MKSPWRLVAAIVSVVGVALLMAVAPHSRGSAPHVAGGTPAPKRDTIPSRDSAATRRPGDPARRTTSDGSVATEKSVSATSTASKASSTAQGKAPAPKRTASTAARDTNPVPKPVWPVRGPAPLAGAILPANRIVAYYGNPLSKRMGILGEVPPDEMLRRLDREVSAWTKADSTTPVIPALQLIATVAQGSPGRDGMYRARMPDSLIETVYGWAQRRNALLILDVQVGKSTLQAELPRLEPFLQRPDVHLALDPEFSMKRGGAPGKYIGTYDASDINYAIELLAGIVDRYRLPPKVLVVHRFTRRMLTNAERIKLDRRVQVVIDMDGWGPPHLKKDSYESYVYSEPVQFTGFKLFYHNDTKAGDPLMRPLDVLALFPRPLYIQYQ